MVGAVPRFLFCRVSGSAVIRGTHAQRRTCLCRGAEPMCVCVCVCHRLLLCFMEVISLADTHRSIRAYKAVVHALYKLISDCSTVVYRGAMIAVRSG